MHYNTHAAETDYKEGSGPELLTGYFAYQALREKIGEIIHADYKSIALIQNATFGMNYVANGLKLKAGDEIINTNQEHGGGYGAWKSLAKRYGLIYKQATMPLLANDPKIGNSNANLIMQGDHEGTKERMEQQMMKKEGYTGHVMAANIIASAFFKKSYTLQTGQSGGTTPPRRP
jgi:hypothetical protein